MPVEEDVIPALPFDSGFLEEASDEPVKGLLLGDSGSGKTGALASLVMAGYKLHILDLDRGVPILRNALGSPKSPYFKYLQNNKINVNEKVFPLTLTEKMRAKGGIIQPATAQVWNKIGNSLENFKIQTANGEINLGNVGNWGLDTVLVVDSLTMMGFAAMWQVQALNQRLGEAFSGYDWQRDVGHAQNNIERMLQLLTSEAIGCHVLVISHITFVDDSKGVAVAPSRDPDAPNMSVKGYPSALGRALSLRLGRYFNNTFQVEQQGNGPSARRYIHTLSQGNVTLKSASPFNLKPRYSIETGLAEIFAALRGQPEPADMIERSNAEAWYKFSAQRGA